MGKATDPVFFNSALPPRVWRPSDEFLAASDLRRFGHRGGAMDSPLPDRPTPPGAPNYGVSRDEGTEARFFARSIRALAFCKARKVLAQREPAAVSTDSLVPRSELASALRTEPERVAGKGTEDSLLWARSIRALALQRPCPASSGAANPGDFAARELLFWARSIRAVPARGVRVLPGVRGAGIRGDGRLTL